MHLGEAWLQKWPPIMHPTFLGGICVKTTMKWSQTWDVACPRRPTISLHPAEYWPSSSKYLLLLSTDLTLDNGFDIKGWWHRWCRRLTLLSRDDITLWLAEDPLSRIWLPPAISSTLQLEMLYFPSTEAIIRFEHSNSYFWTLRKTPYLFRLWRVLATKEKDHIAAVIAYFQEVSLPSRRPTIILLPFPTKPNIYLW